jgi:glycosyltransferase involved in cell wall biosynthesis
MPGDRESVTFALRDADLVAFTSRSEVAPLVPLEASAAGVPWVSFDVGNVSELEGGMVVQDEAGFVAAVRKLLWNHDARVRLADEGRRFVSELDWDTIVGRYELELQRLRLQERRIEDAATHRS